MICGGPGGMMTKTRAAVKARPARAADAEAICALAADLGAGMTNLPADPVRMGELIAGSEALLAGDASQTRVMLVLETAGRIVGTASVWTRIGTRRPFYSFRITPHIRALDGTHQVTTRTLSLVTDFTGCSEVGGLVVDPSVRGGGVGKQAARTRYLFMAAHRDLFSERTVAELRGWQDENGKSPVWRALGKVFFQMPFVEADRLTAGDEDIIAPLAPEHPVYVDLLAPEAQAALGQPHETGKAALSLLLKEDFHNDGHVDIFDGGPTVWAPTDDIRTVRESREGVVAQVVNDLEGVDSLVCAGTGAQFRASRGAVSILNEGLAISADLAATLDLAPGKTIRHVPY